MQSDPNLVKVCVNVDGIDNLHTINKSFPLHKIVEELCKNYNKEVYTSYGLQILQGNNEYVYITNDNFNLIVHGSLLKLLPSIDYMVKSIFTSDEHEERIKYIWLRKLSTDKAFVQQITKENLSSLLQNTLKCTGENLRNILQGLSNLVQYTKYSFITEEFVIFLIRYIKRTESQDLTIVSFILKLLGQIAIKYNYITFISNELKISDLIPFLWREEFSCIQLHTLFLINNYVKFEYNKSAIIEELNSVRNRNIIARYVLSNAKKEENADLAHQVYVYQTYILSTYSDYYNEEILIGSDSFIPLSPRTSNEIYSLEEKNSIIDFEEINKNRKSACSSIIDMSSGSNSPAIKEQNYFNNSIKYGDIQLRKDKMLPTLLPSVISKLTSIGLDYYKRHYKKNYTISILESNHEPGFYTIANQVMNIICKILGIGKEPDDNCILYHPLVFIYIDKKIFVEELFSRALWLLARTKREMKAKTLDDHDKVLAVLECQIKLALDTKPTEYKQLTESLKKFTHDKVYDIWEVQRENAWKTNLKTNSNLNELREKFNEENEKLVIEQRMLILKEGGTFPKLPEKKGKQQYWKIKLSSNNKTLVYGDFDMEYGETIKSTINEIAIGDINHVVFGNVSPHVKDHRIRKPEHFSRCFSLLLKDEGSVDFFADTADIADMWVDGLHALIGKPMNSDLYKKELEQLVEMDLNLHLLEIQDAPLSMEPPPQIPPLPPDFDKPIPPPKLNQVSVSTEITTKKEKFQDDTIGMEIEA